MRNNTSYIPYILALLLLCLLIFVIYKQVKEYHLQDDPMLHILREILKPVHPIFENMKLYRGNKSYTINKEKTFLCLYDEHGDYYPLNSLIFVICHEIAHSLNKTNIGHTEEFYKIFDELLDRAAKLGIYNPSIPMIKNYCEY